MLLVLLLLYAAPAIGQRMEAVFLKCEHLEHPLGIDAAAPRFTWQVADSRLGAAQTAYEIIVDEDAAIVRRGNGTVWKSGKIASSATITTFNGKKLKPRTRYYWAVALWDKNGVKSATSQLSWFETGKMKEPWKAQWMSDGEDTLVYPAPYFRKEVQLQKQVSQARVYIVAAGLFELYLNGAKMGNELLNPMFTRFDKRNLYLSFDVTKELRKGNNAIGVVLGNGWYNHQSWSEWNFNGAMWRNRPAFCLEMQVRYTDGTTATVYSDPTWKTKTGPLIFNSIYTGEHYDARMDLGRWSVPGYDDAGWNKVVQRQAPSTQVVTQAMVPVRIVKEFHNPGVRKINDSVYVFRFPENIAGISKLSIQGARGTVIRLKHGETLNKDERVDQSTIDIYADQRHGADPFQTDIYILKGAGIEEFMPRFNYKGFQYVEVIADRPVRLNAGSLSAYRVNSDVRQVGKIESSNTLVNKIWAATNRSYLSNLHGYPTDCPQREKNGWTGDAHIALETGLLNYDGITVYEKWLADHRDAQQENGMLPAIIPTATWGYHWGNGPDWTSTMLIVPWTLYQYYGDTRVLSDNYPNMKRFVDYITSVSKNDLTDWGLGDWVPYKTIANKELLISLYYYQDALLLSKAAGVMGRATDAVHYRQLALRIKKAINDRFLDTEKAIYATGAQAELSGPLYFGIVPEPLRQRVADNLALRVRADNHHLDVGLLGAKTLLGALSDNGYADLAFEVATQQTYPSWGWWIANGATTLFETWKIETATLSRNHIMFGAISAWFYKSLGGINSDETKPGFHSVIIKPAFVKGLDRFSATYHSASGKIISSWKRLNGQIVLDLAIPANSQGRVRLNNIRSVIDVGSKKEIKSSLINKDGDYLFTAGSYRILIGEDVR